MKNEESKRKVFFSKSSWQKILVLLLACLPFGFANAQNWKPDVNNSGKYILTSVGNHRFCVNNGTDEYEGITYFELKSGKNIEIVFNTNEYILCKSQIKVSNGSLTFRLGDGYSGGDHPTLLRRYSGDNYVINASSSGATAKITFEGNDNYKFVIDGNASYKVTENVSMDRFVLADVMNDYVGRLIYMNGGSLVLNNVEIRNNFSNRSNNTGSSIVVKGDANKGNDIAIDNSEIHHCYDLASGAAMYIDSQSKTTTVTMKNTNVHDCFSESKKPGSQTEYKSGNGCTIRTTGTSLCDMTMTNCNVYNNKSNDSGGGVYWNVKQGELTLINCSLHDNITKGSGGGLKVASHVTVENCRIYRNKAKYHGGGVDFATYTNDDNITGFYPQDGTLSLDSTTEIYENESDFGGGVYYGISPINVNTNDPSNTRTIFSNNHNEQYECSLLIDGTRIAGNKAKNGGGIAIERNTRIYKSDLNIKYGIIEGNSSTNGNGGGIYVESKSDGQVYGEFPYEERDLNVFFGEESSAYELVVCGNTAANGGVAYISGENLNTVFNSGTFGAHESPNTATQNGGGFYVNGGNTFIQGGQVQYNQASNGGGLFIATGCHLEMSDGSVQYNQATGNGGGIYMAGEMYVSGNSLVVTGNKVAGQTNNVYLPDNDHYIYVDNSADPSLFNLGFTVGGNVPVPVFRSGNPAVVQRISDLINLGGEGSVFDDTHLYLPFYTTMMIDDFNPEYLYLIRTWSSVVGSDVETDPAKFKSIDTPLKLAQYMVYVNGLNEQGSHLHTPGKLTADIDMSAYYWVPIGGREKPFEGVFEGNGHTVNGIRCVNVAGYSDFGLFGATKDADISNLFVVNFDVASETNDANIGAIAGEMQGGGILNSSGTGSLYIKGSNTNVGGLVGHADNIVLRNCMTSMEFDGGSKVGGLCGTVINSIVENSFANGLVNQVTGQAGGLASSTDANSVVANCYSRMEVDDVLNYASLVYSNGGTLTHCYAKTSDYTASGTGSNLGRYAATVTPYRYGQFADGASDNLVDGGESLLAKLNSWVGDKEGYSHWMRTSASPVNGDYPILSFDNLQNTLDYVAVVATRDNTELRYTTSANTAIAESNAYGDEVTVYLYRSPKEEVITTDNTSRVKIYIKEDVAILQGDGNTLQNAYVGVTMDNSAGAIDWHMFSSPLEGAPMGVDYDGDSKEYAPWFEAGTPSGMPEYAFYDDDVRDGYFPSSTPYASYDYYTYLEPQYHWINFKRNSNSHWHQDGAHDKIIYTNEDCLERGKGYLLAIGSETYMQSHGMLRGGDVVKTLSYTEGLGRDVIGYNLIGNPYQSYLDFDKFASENGVESYVVLDDDLGGYVSYVPTSSKNSYPSKDGEVPALNGCIHMHQGFFVRSWEPGKTVTFTNEMRQTTPKAESHLRGAQKDYPLVNLVSTEENGVSEYLTMEFGRPEKGGAEKMKSLRNGTSLLYTTIGDEDYSIAFMTQGTSTVPVRFETTEEGTFTMRWNTQNGAFTYLHLVDNKTGVDIDCLDSDEYRFTAAPDDYKSRFKLVVSYEDMEQEEMSTGEVFAFMMDGNLVVNGSGVLEVIDLQGRVMQTERLAGVQSVVSLPASAQGLYLLRMTGTEGTKVQKIVVR